MDPNFKRRLFKEDREPPIFINGRLIKDDERHRVVEVLEDLQAYTDLFGIARKKKGPGARPDESVKKPGDPNTLIMHQAKREEVSQYLNKFSLIETI